MTDDSTQKESCDTSAIRNPYIAFEEEYRDQIKARYGLTKKGKHRSVTRCISFKSGADWARAYTQDEYAEALKMAEAKLRRAHEVIRNANFAIVQSSGRWEQAFEFLNNYLCNEAEDALATIRRLRGDGGGT